MCQKPTLLACWEQEPDIDFLNLKLELEFSRDLKSEELQPIIKILCIWEKWENNKRQGL